jgi:hypothetical protein
MKFLLDYFFKITTINPTPAASTAFLKQVCLVVLPKSGQEGNVGTIYECTTAAQVAVRTDNVDATQLFNAGMAKVFILLANDLYLEEYLEDQDSEFYTVLVSSDFAAAAVTPTKATGTFTVTSYANLVSGTDDTVTIDGVVFTAQAGAAVLGETTFQAATSNDATAASLAAQINGHTATAAKVVASVVGAVVTLTAVDFYSTGNYAINYTDNDTNVGITKSGTAMTGGDGLSAGSFSGVIGVWSSDLDLLEAQAVIEKRCAFYGNSTNKAKNMCYAFGKLLSNSLSWKNQQYVTMPFDDGIDTLGEAESLFDDKISFVLMDDEFGKRLALFACGSKAITAPYILRNLEIDLQSAALTYVSANNPDYTLTEAALIEDECQKVINEDYIATKLISSGKIEITLEEDNFVAAGRITVPTPKVLWRIAGEMTQTS